LNEDDVGTVLSSVQSGGSSIAFYPVASYNLPASIQAAPAAYPSTASQQIIPQVGWNPISTNTASAISLIAFRGVIRVNSSVSVYSSSTPVWTGNDKWAFIGNGQTKPVQALREFSTVRMVGRFATRVASYYLTVATDGVLYIPGLCFEQSSPIIQSSPPVISTIFQFNAGLSIV